MRTAGIVLCVVFTASVFGFAEWCAVKGIAAAFGGPAEPPLEFYKLDSEKIVVYRGDEPVTHDALKELVKRLNSTSIR